MKKQHSDLTWKYSEEPDIYLYGKPKFNFVRLFVIIGIVILFGVGAYFGYTNKDYISDMITNPSIQFTKNEIELEVGTDFDYKSVVVKDNLLDRYEVIYPEKSSFDTTKLGEYTLEYKLKTLTTENNSTVLLKVVDKTPPNLTLTEAEITLYRGEETDKFDGNTYIKDFNDNYYPKNELSLVIGKVFNWELDTTSIEYVLTDPSNNITVKTLTINVKDKEIGEVIVKYVGPDGKVIDDNEITLSGEVGESYKVERKLLEGYKLKGFTKDSAPENGTFTKEKQTVILVYDRVEKPTEEKTENSSGTENNSEEGTITKNESSDSSTRENIAPNNNSQQQESSTNVESSKVEESTPTQQVQPRGHYIDGIHDITIKKGTTFDQLIPLLQDGVSSDEDIQVMFGTLTQDALNTPGKYTVIYKTNSLEKTITVTVIE